MRKTALSLTPQAMYNQFKRPSAESVRELCKTSIRETVDSHRKYTSVLNWLLPPPGEAIAKPRGGSSSAVHEAGRKNREIFVSSSVFLQADPE